MAKRKQEPPLKNRPSASEDHAATLDQSAQTASAGAFHAAPDSIPTSIVGVGASAGGLEAFEQLLSALPVKSGMAFVLVQHLAPKHESILSQLLGRATTLPVVEVKEGVRVEANHVYVIPPNKDMSIAKGILHLSSL